MKSVDVILLIEALTPLVLALIRLVESLIVGPKRGPERREAVVAMAKAAVRSGMIYDEHGTKFSWSAEAEPALVERINEIVAQGKADA